MPAQPKPEKPERKYPSIAAVFTGGRWRWRGCVRVDGKQIVGPLQDDQQAAFYDADRLRDQAKRKRPTITLGQCFNRLIERAQDRGLAPHTVDGNWRYPATGALKYFHEDAAMESIDVHVVRRYALWCLDGDPSLDEKGRAKRGPLSARTVRKTYLRIIDSAFEIADMPSPVPAAKRDLQARLRVLGAPVIGFEIEEVAAILKRIREWDPKAAPRAKADATYFALVATTGMRAGELARIRARDIHFEQGLINIVAKSRAHPRLEPIAPEILEDLRELVGKLKGPDSPIVPSRGKRRATDPEWGPGARHLNRMCETWKKRLGEPRLNLRSLRRAHGSGLDFLGSSFAVVRDSLGHSRTSDETQRYLTTTHRRILEAKRQLSGHLLRPHSEGEGQSGSDRVD